MKQRLTRGDLGDLNLFRVIAHAGGFRKAAAELDLSASALSHAMRGLEERQGVRLFNRTNRSVTVTAAGRDLLDKVERGMGEIERGLEDLNRFRDRPAGHLRLNVMSDAARLVMAGVVSEYMAKYPEVQLELVVQDEVVDIVNDGFDAGIRYGGTVPEDMIAIPLGPDLQWITVASPSYLEAAPPLVTPADLAGHRCLGIRMGSGKIYHWELGDGDNETVVSTEWAIVLNETTISIEIAETGGGICYCLADRVEQQLAAGTLVQVLPEWTSPGPGYHLYYPSRRQLPEALRALLRMIQAKRR